MKIFGSLVNYPMVKSGFILLPCHSLLVHEKNLSTDNWLLCMIIRILVHFLNKKSRTWAKILLWKSNVRIWIFHAANWIIIFSVNHWKPKAAWQTVNFEDHRRFNPRATLKYDLMQIKPNYDPKMDGLFNPNENDSFLEMRAHEIVKVLRF